MALPSKTITFFMLVMNHVLKHFTVVNVYARVLVVVNTCKVETPPKFLSWRCVFKAQFVAVLFNFLSKMGPSAWWLNLLEIFQSIFPICRWLGKAGRLWAGFWYSILMSCCFVVECRRQSYTAARRENAWQKREAKSTFVYAQAISQPVNDLK